MSDMGSVTSYATQGLRLWADPRSPHGDECPCLICADVRAYLGAPPLIGTPAPAAQREERAS